MHGCTHIHTIVPPFGFMYFHMVQLSWCNIYHITHPDFVRYWYKSLHSHHIWGFITSVEEIMFLFCLVCQQEMFPTVCRHKDNWLNWMSDTGHLSLTPFCSHLSLPSLEPTVHKNYSLYLKIHVGIKHLFLSKYNLRIKKMSSLHILEIVCSHWFGPNIKNFILDM